MNRGLEAGARIHIEATSRSMGSPGTGSPQLAFSVPARSTLRREHCRGLSQLSGQQVGLRHCLLPQQERRDHLGQPMRLVAQPIRPECGHEGSAQTEAAANEGLC